MQWPGISIAGHLRQQELGILPFDFRLLRIRFDRRAAPLYLSLRSRASPVAAAH
jgi:hypothetical protein